MIVTEAFITNGTDTVTALSYILHISGSQYMVRGFLEIPIDPFRGLTCCFHNKTII